MEELEKEEIEIFEDLGDNENDENDEKKGHGGIKLRIIAGLLVLTTAASSYVLITRDSRKIKKTSIDDICSQLNSDTDNRIDIPYDMQIKLNILNRYIDLSNKLNKLYNEYNDVITSDINLGSTTVTNGEYIPLAEEELKDIEDKIETIYSKDITVDERIQTANSVLSYSSQVNGYLQFNGYNDVYLCMMNLLSMDAANIDGVDPSCISASYDSDSNEIIASRDNIDGGATYNNTYGGLYYNFGLINSIENCFNKCQTSNILLSDKSASIVNKDEAVVAYYEDSDNLVIKYDKNTNNELLAIINEIKQIPFRGVSVNNKNTIKYGFMVDGIPAKKLVK